MSHAEKILQEYFTEAWIMEFTGYSHKSIQTFRSLGSDKIPPAKKIGTKWFYPVKEFKAWLEKHPTIKGIM